MITLVLTLVVCFSLAATFARRFHWVPRRPQAVVRPQRRALPRWAGIAVRVAGGVVCAGAFLVLFGQSASADELPPEPDASVAIEQLSSAETDTTFEDAAVAADSSEVSAEGESTSSAEPVSSNPEQSEPASSIFVCR